MTEYYMEKRDFTRACLSCVRDIMAIMCVPLLELLCQTTMGWILAFEYKLSGTCGLLRSCPIMTGTKCHRFPRPRCWK
jgi:hypothetical protein